MDGSDTYYLFHSEEEEQEEDEKRNNRNRLQYKTHIKSYRITRRECHETKTPLKLDFFSELTVV